MTVRESPGVPAGAVGPPADGGEGAGTEDAGGSAPPLASLLEGLAESLRERRHDLLDRVHDRLWERLRGAAQRLGELRDEALGSDDELRDAGRAVRMACDDLEELAGWDVLAGALTRHLEDVAGLAHAIPRHLEPSGRSGTGDGGRPARAAVRVSLSHDYAEALRSGLDAETLVTAPARALPRSPADLLGAEDSTDALAEAVDLAERHLRIVLEEAAERAVRAAGRHAEDRGLAGRLRLRWRLGRTEGMRRDAALSLDRTLAGAAEEARRHREDRRFAADLARRKRALNEAAEEAAARLEEAAGRAGDLRRLADRLEEAGHRAARTSSEAATRGEPSSDARIASPASRLAEIHTRVREVTAALRSSLPAMDRPEAPFPRALDRTVRLSRALFELSGSEAEGRGVPERDGGPGPETAAALRARVSRAVAAVRDQIWEAEQILGQGVQAARAASAGESADAGELSGLVRTTGERTAQRLRAAADELDGRVGRAAEEVRDLPDELIAEIKRRVHAARTGAEPAGTLRQGLATARERGARLARRAASVGEPAVGVLRDLADRFLPGGRAGAAGRRLEQAGEEVDFAREVAATDPRGDGAEMEDLPLLYRWLFRPEPLDDPHLMQGRGEEMDRLREATDRWRRGRDAAVAVVGEPGSGKTTLLNCWSHEVGGAAPLRRGRVDRRLSDREEAARWFASFLGADAGGTIRKGTDVAEALRDRREIVLLENGERLFRREVGGFGAVETLVELMEGTAGRLAWAVSFELEAWLYLRTVTALEGPFGDVVRLGSLDRDELEEAVVSRHRLTGFDLRFVADETLPRRRRSRLEGTSEAEEQRLLREWYFDDLHRAARRTVGRAFHLWRTSLRPGSEGEVRVLPIRAPDVGFLAELGRETLFLLAAFVLHGDLARPEVERLSGADGDEARERLARLERLGVLRPVEGLPRPAPLCIDRRLHAPVVDRLRDERLLHL